jgi:hypothetical protein
LAGYGGLLERLRRLEVRHGELGQALKLLEAACLASTGDPQRCRLLAGLLRDHALFGGRLDAREVREVLDRFELRGSCLVEKGVEVDPRACRGSGLLVVGRRGAALLLRGSAAGLALGGECAVAVGQADALDAAFQRSLRGLRPVEEGLLEAWQGGAVVGVGACGPELLAELAGRLERAGDRYPKLYRECTSEAEGRVDLGRVLEEEVGDCRRLLAGGGR